MRRHSTLKWILLSVAALLIAQPAWGQVGMRGRLGHQVGEQPGFDENFTRLGGFVPIWQTDECNCLIFNDSQVTFDNYGLWGGSLGLGARTFLPGSDCAVGVNGYFDWREFGGVIDDLTFTQLGVGADLIGPEWGAHVNGYLSNTEDRSDGLLVTDSRYTGNNLELDIGERMYAGLSGIDAEVSYSFWHSQVALGGYYRTDDDLLEDAIGPTARAQVWFSDSVIIYGRIAHDELFGTSTSVGVVWNFGVARTLFGNGSTVTDPYDGSRCQRISAPVQRQYNIPVARYVSGRGSQLACNPDGSLVTITHVDGTEMADGIGTFEDPRNVLAASTDQIVLVQPDAYDLGATYVMGQSDQRLLAAGTKPHFVTVKLDGGLTSVQLPGTGGGAPTILSGMGDPLISVTATGTEVSGFTINTTGMQTGIQVTGNDNNINCNVISGDAMMMGIGILVDGASGNLLRDNEATSNRIGYSFEGATDTTVSRNLAENNAEYGFDVSGAADNINFTNNTARSNTMAGFNVANIMGGTYTGNFSGNTATGPTQMYGFMVDVDTYIGNFTGNTATGNTMTNAQFLIGTEFRGNITGNTLNSSVMGGGLAVFAVGATFNGNVSGNTANSNMGASGISLDVMDFNGNIQNNTANSNAFNGVDLFGTDFTGSFSGNTANNNLGPFGVSVGVTNFIGSYDNNTTNNNAVAGTLFDVDLFRGPGGDPGSFSGNTANNNGTAMAPGTGFDLEIDEFVANMDGNTANENGWGVNLEVDDFTGNITNNTTNLNVTMAGDGAGFVLNGGVNGVVNPTATFTGDILMNTAESNNHGFVLDVDDFTGNITDNNFNTNTNDAGTGFAFDGTFDTFNGQIINNAATGNDQGLFGTTTTFGPNFANAPNAGAFGNTDFDLGGNLFVPQVFAP